MEKKIDRVIAWISNIIGYVGYVGIVAIMLLIAVDVIARGILKSGILGSYEIVERMLLVTIFAAFAFTQTHRGHVHVTLFVSKLPKKLGMVIFGLLGLLSTAASVFCAYAIVEQGNYSYTAGTHTGVLLIPLYPFYYIAAFCTVIFAITLLWDSVKCFIGISSEECCMDIRSSWE